MQTHPVFLAFMMALAGCHTQYVEGPTADAYTARSQEQGALIVRVANEATLHELDVDAALDVRAATNLVAQRPFETLEEVDAVAYVGHAALQKLQDYGEQRWGAADPDVWALRAANELSFDELDIDVALDVRAARHIVDLRPFATMEELDLVPYVGESALDKLRRYGEALWSDALSEDPDCPTNHVRSGNGQIYPSLEEAIERTAEGLELLLCPGTFRGTLVDGMVGSGRGVSVLELTHTHYSNSEGLSVSNMTITADDHLRFDNFDGMHFLDVDFEMPLSVDLCVDARFDNCQFTSWSGGEPGIHLDSPVLNGHPRTVITHATFVGGYGVSVERATLGMYDTTLHNLDVAVSLDSSGSVLSVTNVDFGIGATDNDVDVRTPGGDVRDLYDDVTMDCYGYGGCQR